MTIKQSGQWQLLIVDGVTIGWMGNREQAETVAKLWNGEE